MHWQRLCRCHDWTGGLVAFSWSEMLNFIEHGHNDAGKQTYPPNRIIRVGDAT